jgi:hypothetical protein
MRRDGLFTSRARDTVSLIAEVIQMATSGPSTLGSTTFLLSGLIEAIHRAADASALRRLTLRSVTRSSSSDSVLLAPGDLQHGSGTVTCG